MNLAPPTQAAPPIRVLAAYGADETPTGANLGAGRTFRIVVDGATVFMKRAQGRARARLRHEAAATAEVQRLGDGCAPRVRRTCAGALSLDDSDASWAAFEWLEGRTGHFEDGPATAQHLAWLHTSAVRFPPKRARVGRRDTLPPRDALPSPELIQARARAARAQKLLANLPRAPVHGDANPNNVVLTSAGVRLVDWEFARRDIRLFDLCAWRARWCAAKGEYELAAEPEFAVFTEAYADAAAALGFRLTPEERRLLPDALILYWLMIFRDLSATPGGAIPAAAVRPVLHAVGASTPGGALC